MKNSKLKQKTQNSSKKLINSGKKLNDSANPLGLLAENASKKKAGVIKDTYIIKIYVSLGVMPFCVKFSFLQLFMCLNIGEKFILTFYLIFFGTYKAVNGFFLQIKSNQVIFLQ